MEFALAGGGTEVGIIMILIRRGSEGNFICPAACHEHREGSIASPVFSPDFKEEERGMR